MNPKPWKSLLLACAGVMVCAAAQAQADVSALRGRSIISPTWWNRR